MLNELEYPFDSQVVLKKKRSLKKELLSKKKTLIEKKIAILGGSTTNDIRDIIELFLLDNNIKPIFYESEFGQFWEDATFENKILEEFNPDLIYIHTSNRNILNYPDPKCSFDDVKALLESEFDRYKDIWSSIRDKYGCPIIQNNFEMPFFRLFGNLDSTDYRGRTNFILKLNIKFSEYAEENDDLIINDINYLSSSYGLEKWSQPKEWYMYKYSLALDAIPLLAFNVCNLIKSIYGKSKKVLVLDLDNTLWDGVIGDDGQEGIEIGEETSIGQAFKEFQQYISMFKDFGILLAVNSKNDMENALLGLNHPSGVLKPEDFLVIKANWNNKDININEIANELNLGPDSFVFIDDNPVERDIVKKGIYGISVPSITSVENYINTIDKGGYFEVIKLSNEDLVRNKTYKTNVERMNKKNNYVDYKDFLRSLEMVAEIKSFSKLYVPRIAQLTNKTNQFNLTTLRCSQSDIESMMDDNLSINLYGILKDKYGDNGLTSVLVGKIKNETIHLNLWLMSCRVLKRNLEYAMMDELISLAKKRKNLKTIKGYYYATKKNNMVKEFYKDLGFKKVDENDESSIWELEIEEYKKLNEVIEVFN